MNNELLPFDQLNVSGDGPKMTVRSVADALGVDISTVGKKVKMLFPEIIENGKTTWLTEIQVVKIKEAIVNNPNLGRVAEVRKINTDLEMEEKMFEVMDWQKSKIQQLRRDLEIYKPKAEAFDSFIRSDQQMSITDAGKHFGLTRGQVFALLRAKEMLLKSDLPSAKAIDLKILMTRETRAGIKPDGTQRYAQQAVVGAEQMDNFRRFIDANRKLLIGAN